MNIAIGYYGRIRRRNKGKRPIFERYRERFTSRRATAEPVQFGDSASCFESIDPALDFVPIFIQTVKTQNLL